MSLNLTSQQLRVTLQALESDTIGTYSSNRQGIIDGVIAEIRAEVAFLDEEMQA